MPPLPTGVRGLDAVRRKLQEELTLGDDRKRLHLLVSSLQHQSAAVRYAAGCWWCCTHAKLMFALNGAWLS
jgi:hypothetical protein